ncbi:hypothetical protein AK812_SmicGene43996 [Symbiodinium microadriaticum]|uniref:Uncharacterized protein n=1 Tax=Symbiodinium microadriaticum TaxID=2951 RepID=A0A1Q9BZL6_SYMMI|nr:hypothetical protein AK812_SmicGene43996 [Symbiodinium microadriaticum]
MPRGPRSMSIARAKLVRLVVKMRLAVEATSPVRDLLLRWSGPPSVSWSTPTRTAACLRSRWGKGMLPLTLSPRLSAVLTPALFADDVVDQALAQAPVRTVEVDSSDSISDRPPRSEPEATAPTVARRLCSLRQRRPLRLPLRYGATRVLGRHQRVLDEQRFSKARGRTSQQFLFQFGAVRTSRAPIESRWKTWQRLCAAGSLDPLPLTQEKIFKVGAHLKEGKYRSSAQYFSVAKQRRRETEHPWTDVLDLAVQQAVRSISRGPGPSRPKRDLFVDRAPSDLDEQVVVLTFVCRWPPEHQFVEPCAVLAVALWFLLRGIEVANVRCTDVTLNRGVARLAQVVGFCLYQRVYWLEAIAQIISIAVVVRDQFDCIVCFVDNTAVVDSLFAEPPHSEGDGGGLYTDGSFSQEAESMVTFENCSNDGGGARVWKVFTQAPKSSAIFRGGLYTDGSFSQEAESMVTFENCSNDGGGARVWKVFTQAPKSSAIFRGGLYTDGSFSQEAESMVTFENCTEELRHLPQLQGEIWSLGCNVLVTVASGSVLGGGIHAPGSYEQEAGSSVLFEHCSADRDGGGVATKDLSGNGSMHFKSCRARTGGGLSITTGRAVRHDGSLAFEECNASILGGGLYIDAGQGQFRKLLFDRCDADVSAAALAAIAANGTEAELRLEELSLLRGSEGNVNDIAVPGLLKLGSVHLSTASSSGIYISAHNLSLEDVMNCTNTSACTFRANAARWAGFLCPLGTGSVDFEGRRKPTLTMRTVARDRPGLMVELEDVKRSFHCPNEAVQWITFLAQRTFLFAIGALSAFGAKKAGDLKQSSIYLNQLMAFATISNTILAAVLQTQTAKDIKSANFFFNAAMHTAEAASGQGSLRSASSQCLLSYLGYERLSVDGFGMSAQK